MSHEAPRHWRLRHHRLRLEGFKRETEDGIIEVSATGVSWVEKAGNGYHRDENPFEGKIIYESQEPTPIALHIHQEVEIDSAGD